MSDDDSAKAIEARRWLDEQCERRGSAVAARTVDWDRVALKRVVRDPLESLRHDRSMAASFLKTGADRLPLNGDWMAGWEYNPFLRVVLARTWHVAPAALGLVLMVLVAARMFIPGAGWFWPSLALAFVGASAAAAITTTWHLRRLRGIVHEELFATLLSPREVIQGLAMVPWAVSTGWCIVFFTLDAILAAAVWLPKLPGVFVAMIVLNLVGRFVLYFVVKGAIAHAVAIAVREHLGRPASDMAVWRASMRLMGMVVVHLLRATWLVWTILLAFVIFLWSALTFGMWGIPVGLVAFPAVAMLALIVLRVPVELQPPAHLSPFHPYDTDFAQWQLLGGDVDP